MEYRIRITEVAEQQFRALPIRDQRTLQATILARLLHEPTTVTRNVKRLRLNPVAEYELRAGDLRVLYDVAGEEVIVTLVGKKVGNKLLVLGEEFRGHQDHAPESPGGGPDGSPE